MPSTLLPALIIISCLTLVRCDYIFLLCFTKASASYRTVRGYIYLGCWDKPCSVAMTAEIVEHTLTIAPFESLQKTARVNKFSLGRSFYPVRLKSKQKITVTGGLWDGKVYFYGLFTVYAVESKDTTFEVGIFKGLNQYLLIIPAFDKTRVRIYQKDEGTLDLKTTDRRVNSKLTFIHHFNKPLLEGTGVLIVADRMIAVFTCSDVVQAQVRGLPAKTLQEFMFFIAGMSLVKRKKHTLLITTAVGKDNEVVFMDEAMANLTIKLKGIKRLPTTKEVDHTFVTLAARCDSPLTIAIHYKGELSEQSIVSFLLQEFDQKSTYVVWEWFVDGKTISFKALSYVAGNIKHDQRLAFTPVEGKVDRYQGWGVYMFAESRAGTYHTLATGFNSFTNEIYKTTTPAPPTTPSRSTHKTVFETRAPKCTNCFGGANRNLLADWMTFGVFMPMSLSLLILSLYAIKVYRRPPPQDKADMYADLIEEAVEEGIEEPRVQPSNTDIY